MAATLNEIFYSNYGCILLENEASYIQCNSVKVGRNRLLLTGIGEGGGVYYYSAYNPEQLLNKDSYNIEGAIRAATNESATIKKDSTLMDNKYHFLKWCKRFNANKNYGIALIYKMTSSYVRLFVAFIKYVDGVIINAQTMSSDPNDLFNYGSTWSEKYNAGIVTRDSVLESTFNDNDEAVFENFTAIGWIRSIRNIDSYEIKHINCEVFFWNGNLNVKERWNCLPTNTNDVYADIAIENDGSQYFDAYFIDLYENRTTEKLQLSAEEAQDSTRGDSPDYPNADKPNSSQSEKPTNIDNSNVSDSIDLETNNNSIAIVGNLINMYRIDASALRTLNTFLWSTDFFDTLSKYVNGDPFKCIVSLMSVPFEVVANTSFNISLLGQDTGATGGYIINTIATIDCGTLDVPFYYGNFIDYNTTVGIYLPYCGYHSLDIQDIIGSVVTLSYKVDLMSGACVANLKVNKGRLSSYIYQYAGNMGIEYPFSSADRSRIISAIINSTSSMIAAPTASTAVNSIVSLAGANAPNISRSSGYNGNSGILAPQTPYLYIQRPVQSKALDLSTISGQPSNITVPLSSCTGFTKVKDIHLKVACLDEEYKEILSLLKEGIII